MNFNEMVQYALGCVTQKYADFNGRARRTEYWSFTLFVSAVSMILNLLYSHTDSTIFNILTIIFSLAVLVPSLAVSWRRLHDIGKPGAWYFIGLIPVIGWIVMIYWLCQEGVTGENEYGPDPKQEA